MRDTRIPPGRREGPDAAYGGEGETPLLWSAARTSEPRRRVKAPASRGAPTCETRRALARGRRPSMIGGGPRTTPRYRASASIGRRSRTEVEHADRGSPRIQNLRTAWRGRHHSRSPAGWRPDGAHPGGAPAASQATSGGARCSAAGADIDAPRRAAATGSRRSRRRSSTAKDRIDEA
jgi:hypothetical protein